jgi:hypothetical protein
MFEASGMLPVNGIDLPVVGHIKSDAERVKAYAGPLTKSLEILPVSAESAQAAVSWHHWLAKSVLKESPQPQNACYFPCDW